MDFTPPFRIPVMDLTGCLLNFQSNRRCADFELRYFECMEAYGIPRGYKKCSDMFEDYRECHVQSKQRARIGAIKTERQRQYKAGNLSKQYSDPPKEDCF